MSILADNWHHMFAVCWFILCFFGYFSYANRKSRDTPCLANVMHRLRRQWIRESLQRENRVPDTHTIATLERSVSFFASTTMFIVAGLVTLFGSSEKIVPLLSSLSFSKKITAEQWQAKILLLLIIFIYAFFKFTWSLRQYSFMSVMLVGAPMKSKLLNETHAERYIDNISHLASKAANNFNSGMRSYYFSIAVLGWLISPWLFVLMCGLIVYVLYRREFKSNTLKILMKDLEDQ